MKRSRKYLSLREMLHQPMLGATICLFCVCMFCQIGSAGEDFVVSQDSVSIVHPGAVIKDAPPDDWTHLVLKSCPIASAGDTDGLSNLDRSLSSSFRTVTLAKVDQRVVDGKREFQLNRVGVGICMPIEGMGDTVISPDTQKELGAGLGFLARTVLSKIYTELAKVHYVCRSDTSAVYDSPVIIRYEGKNREMVIRYALIVNQENGKLITMAWLIEVDSRGKYTDVAGDVQWLPENQILRCDLYVDGNEYTLGIPSKRAFACVGIPPGKVKFGLPKNLTAIACSPKLSEADAETLVSSLRRVIAFHEKKQAN